MKKIAILFVSTLIASASFTSCNNNSAKAPAPKNAQDSLSYAYGVGMGSSIKENLKNFPAEVNVDIFAKTFIQALKNDTANLVFTPEESYKIFQSCIASIQAKEAKVLEKEGEEFLAKNAKKDSVKVTKSGLQYKVIKEGKGKKPTAESTVKVNYKGTLLDGTVFDSSYERNQPATFPVNRVIKGWTEGLQLMTPGSHYQFFIPADLAYGNQGQGPKIKPGATLIFDVELLEVEKSK